MVIDMTTQNYCMVNQTTNVCDNVCIWDGNPNTWTPPANYLMLVQATTPAKIWTWNAADKVWQLTVQVGEGGVGFTWDGTYLTTNAPMPPAQPETTGTQTL
jgi:hypothetical protein